MSRSLVWVLCLLWFGPAVPKSSGQETTIQDSGYDYFKFDSRPIIDRDPFDLLIFSGGQSYEILPLGLPFGEALPRRGKALFKLMEEPDATITYAAPWNMIAEVRPFSGIILEVAKRLEAKNELSEAYRYYNYLMNHPMFEGRRPKIDLFEIMVRDAGASLMEKSYWDALTCFEELKSKFPGRRFNLGSDIKTANEGIQFCAARLIEEKYEQKLFRQVRDLLATISQRHEREIATLNQEWTARIHEDALKHLDSLNEALAQGDPVLAQDRLRTMLDIAPDLPQAVELRKMIIEKYPMIIVGVDQLPPVRDPRIIESWASRRTGKLVRKLLMEFVKQDEDGGVYRFELGSIDAIGEEGRDYRFRLRMDDPEAPVLSSMQMAQMLDQVATPGHNYFHPVWARALKSVEVEDTDRVRFRLNHPYLLPTALLQIPFLPTDREGSDGPYEIMRVEPERVLYGPNTQATKQQSESVRNQPLLVEKLQADPTRGTELLMSGSIDVLDRVFPGELLRLQQAAGIEVRRYQIPSVHWLIPNPRNEWTRNQAFRRGLLYAIDREKLVRQILTNDQELDGYQVISGPFPVGMDESDPLMYANNFKIRPVPYSQDLGAVFVQMAASQIQALNRRIAEAKIRAAVARGDLTEEQAVLATAELGPDPSEVRPADVASDRDKPSEDQAPPPPADLPKPPELILAYPKGAQPETICGFVARNWGAIGIKVKLVELPEGLVMPPDDNYDFVFVECTMQEPLVDARRIFGRTGLVK
ncbi:MAG: ABC transporter substrate-binding protein, partial [Pirellulaceae bacterium]|nr:ABC transporter substrate-binding protein [Pirellulaceae bacterium]